METALSHPDRLSPEQVRTAADLVMERAVYAPSVVGHFGLNLPVYLHLTSPLRRYADLLNQRILLALLAGAVSPYSKEELEQKAAVLNAEEQRRKTALKSHLLAVYDAELQQAMVVSDEEEEKVKLASLSAKSFHSTLRIAAESATLSANLEQEILNRLDGY